MSADAVPVTRAKDQQGTKYTALLSQLIPEAMQSNSPMKAQRGQVYLPGKVVDGSRIAIGSFKSILEGSSKPLALKRLDEYQLRENGDELYCDLFYHAENIPQPVAYSTTNFD